MVCQRRCAIYIELGRSIHWVGEGVYSRGEETGQEVSDDATDGVLSKDIETVVDSDPELDLGGQVAANATHNTKDDRRPRRDEAGGRRDGDETLQHIDKLAHKLRSAK